MGWYTNHTIPLFDFVISWRFEAGEVLQQSTLVRVNNYLEDDAKATS